jgi:hypothetical protein
MRRRRDSEKEQEMKLEMNGEGLHIMIKWREARAALKQLIPLIVAAASLLAAPEVARMISTISR